MFVIDKTKKLVDLLVEQGRLKRDVALSWKNLTNFEVEQKIKSEKMLSSEDIARTYAQLYNLPYVSLRDLQIKPEILDLIPKDTAQKFKIAVYGLSPNSEPVKGAYSQTLQIAVAEPDRLSSNITEALKMLEQKKRLKIELAVTTPEDLNNILAKYQTQKSESPPAQIPVTVNKTLPSPPSSSSPSAPESPEAPRKLSITNPIINLRTIDLDKLQIPYETICKFPEDIARKYRMLVFEAPHPSFIKVAVSDPYNKKIREILDFIKEKNDIAIQEYITTPEQIFRAMRYYHKPAPETSASPIPAKPVPMPPPPSSSPPPPPPKPKPVPRPVSPPPPPKIVPRPPETFPLKPPMPAPKVPIPKADERQKFVLKPQPKPTFVEPKPMSIESPPLPVQKVVPQPQPIPEVREHLPRPAPIQIAAEDKNLDKFLGQRIGSVQDLQGIAETGNIPKTVAAIITLAVAKKASDIHIESEENDLRVRFRVDGILKDIIKLPMSSQPAILSRIKILSKLKIDETRIPQDGRFDVLTGGHAIDLRVSTLPTVHGEKAAMRILDKSARIYSLEELGLAGRSLKMVIDNIDKPYGVVLATGPTGSGKSTTLYAILNRISNASVNIVTLEDPVEYEVPGVNQCQIKPKIGFTFANGLRSVLRQDPNIIMVGEIRDAETASLATHAALTGHLVLSSLHTNDAAGALPRIINMGIEPFLITSSINVIIAQRLVRKLCPKCVRPAKIPEPIIKDIERELAGFNFPSPYQFLEGKGCQNCENGYSGRIGIFEVLAMTDKIENCVVSRKTSSEIKAEAIREGMVTMKQDGLIKAIKGQTSVNEVLRVMTI